MAVLDRQVEVLIVVDEHTVGIGEHTLAPGGEIIAIPVQDNQWVFAPVEEVHPILGVGDDGRLSQLPTFGQLFPILHLLVGVLAIADGGHVVTSSIRFLFVIPAFAGIQKLRYEETERIACDFDHWIPAFAGMTVVGRE